MKEKAKYILLIDKRHSLLLFFPFIFKYEKILRSIYNNIIILNNVKCITKIIMKKKQLLNQIFKIQFVPGFLVIRQHNSFSSSYSSSCTVYSLPGMQKKSRTKNVHRILKKNIANLHFRICSLCLCVFFSCPTKFLT